MAEERTWVGLDIGASSIKAAMMRDGVPVLAVSQPLATGVIERGELADPEALTQALRRLWRDADFPTRSVAITLNGRATALRVLELPDPGSEDRLMRSVRLNAGVLLSPLNPRTTVMGYQRLAQEGVHIQMAVAAASQTLVRQFLPAVEKAGLEVLGAELPSTARNRTYQLGITPPNFVLMVVDVGAELTCVSMCTQDGTQFMRVLTIGGNDFTRALEDTDDWAAAEQQKFLSGITRVPSASRLSQDEVDRNQNQMQPVADQLIQEVGNTLAFYRALPEAREVHQLIVTGGGSRLAGLAELMGNYLAPGLLGVPSPRDVVAQVPDLDLFGAAFGVADAERFSLPVMSRRVRRRARGATDDGRRTMRRSQNSIPPYILVGVGAALIGAFVLFWAAPQVEDRRTSAQATLLDRQSAVTTPRAPQGEQASVARYETIADIIDSRSAYITTIRSIELALTDASVAVQRMEAGSGEVVLTISGSERDGDALVRLLEDEGLSARAGGTDASGARQVIVEVPVG